jgi:acyl-CoA synthetase (AMP-forming)/AMP-acid ligase II
VIWQPTGDILLLLVDVALAGSIGILLLGRIKEPRTLWLLRGYLFLVALAWLVQRYAPLPLTSKLIDALVLACSLALAILWQGDLRRLMELLGTGRIGVGGPTLAKGYRNPCTPDPFAETGWFITDDVGALDDSGRLRVIGRLDDAISSGGLTVMPGPVEAVLAQHPAIAECAVLGVDDDHLGQRVVAAVVLRARMPAPTLAEVRDFVALSLDRTAAPREVHVVDRLPRRGIGKIDRRALHAMVGDGGHAPG